MQNTSRKIDFPEYISDINEEVWERYDVQVDEHDIIFKGTCHKHGFN